MGDTHGHYSKRYLVVSETEPVDPVDGLLWYDPTPCPPTTTTTEAPVTTTTTAITETTTTTTTEQSWDYVGELTAGQDVFFIGIGWCSEAPLIAGSISPIPVQVSGFLETTVISWWNTGKLLVKNFGEVPNSANYIEIEGTLYGPLPIDGEGIPCANPFVVGNTYTVKLR